MPKTIKKLDLEMGKVSNEEKLKIFKTALERYLNIESLDIDGMDLDLESMAYMALHPSLEAHCFAEKDSLTRAIDRAAAEVGVDMETEGDTDTIANVLMAFRTYRKILNNPYEHVGLLVDIVTKIQNLRDSLRSTDRAEDETLSKYFVKATSQFRAAVEKEYDGFAVLDKDSLNNAFGQLIRREAQAIMPRIVQQCEDELQRLINANTAQSGSKKMNRPQQGADDEVEPALKKQN